MCSDYLLTLSRAERSTDTKESFDLKVQGAFEECYGVGCVDYWCVGGEKHEEEGFHYHCSWPCNF